MIKSILSQKILHSPWHKITAIALMLSFVTFLLLVAHVLLLLWHVSQHHDLEQLVVNIAGANMEYANIKIAIQLQ
ncbi:MAG: hypothetical protein LBH03_02120 [Holophagales bacterium]|jgi:hypothetical protein|nr:hypothetical protein [Holophagales bacterium]